MTLSEILPLLELLAVSGILLLELIGVIDQITTNNLQRKYWEERAAYYQRRAKLQSLPAGRTKPLSTQKNKTPATVATAAGESSVLFDGTSSAQSASIPASSTSPASQAPEVSKDPEGPMTSA